MQTAHQRRRWAYRMIHDVLCPQYPGINHERIDRIYTADGLLIRKRKKTKRIGVRVPLVATLALNQTWSMDFVSDAIARPGAVSRRIKCLTVADDFSHECVDISVDFGVSGADITRLLDRAVVSPPGVCPFLRIRRLALSCNSRCRPESLSWPNQDLPSH